MASDTEICNLALRKLGEARITSLTEDSPAARTLSDVYEFARDATLRDHPWNFAIKRATLAADSSTPAYEFDVQYAVPADCLRVLGADIDDGSEPWKVEGGYILTNATAPLYVKYIARIEDEGLFDASFVNAFASRLAYEVAETITQNTQKKEAMARDYEVSIRNAKKSDAQEGTPDDYPEDDWVVARL